MEKSSIKTVLNFSLRGKHFDVIFIISQRCQQVAILLPVPWIPAVNVLIILVRFTTGIVVITLQKKVSGFPDNLF